MVVCDGIGYSPRCWISVQWCTMVYIHCGDNLYLQVRWTANSPEDDNHDRMNKQDNDNDCDRNNTNLTMTATLRQQLVDNGNNGPNG